MLTPPSYRTPTVCAVVVTHNRKALLESCLDHLERQTTPPDGVVVVDNCSTDGTDELLESRKDVEVLRLTENRGSSGGFRAGMQAAFDAGFEWLWLMDDDTFPEPQALAALLDGAARAPRRPSVVTSVVRWKDGSLHPMNRPWLRTVDRGQFAEGASAGLAAVRTATWVSTAVHRDAVAKHGLPLAGYFIWLDDMEYISRVLCDSCGYMVPESTVYHWTPAAYDTVSDDRGRFYYKVRNQLWLLRGSSFRGVERATVARALVLAIATYLRRNPNRGRAFRTVAKGLRDGLGRLPRE